MDITIHAPNIERVTLITKNTQLLRDVMHGKYKNARKKFRIQNGDDIYEIEKDKIPYLILGNF